MAGPTQQSNEDGNHYAGYQDPGEFLLTEKQYHDWNVTIVDTKANTEEVIGVHSVDLIAHSSVFRAMMGDPKWVQTKNVKIFNVRMDIFKLILRYVYGGKLAMSKSEAVELAFAADQYIMPRLVDEAGKFLVPNSLEEFFPALTVVAYVSCPDLKTHVVWFIKNNAAVIMDSTEFLDLDSQHVEFILKQNDLNMDEVQVFKYLVRWGKHRVAKTPGKTLQDVLKNTLKFIRWQNMTHEQIVKEVVPTRILTESHVLKLLSASIMKQMSKKGPKVQVFNALKSYDKSDEWGSYVGDKNNSKFIIEVKKNIELQRFKVTTWTGLDTNQGEANTDSSMTITMECSHAGGTDVASRFVEQANDSFKLRLEANNVYKLSVVFPDVLPAYYIVHQPANRPLACCTYKKRTVNNVMSVTYQTPIHVMEIHYIILP